MRVALQQQLRHARLPVLGRHVERGKSFLRRNTGRQKPGRPRRPPQGRGLRAATEAPTPAGTEWAVPPGHRPPPLSPVTEAELLVLLFDGHRAEGWGWPVTLVSSQDPSGLFRADPETFHDERMKAGWVDEKRQFKATQGRDGPPLPGTQRRPACCFWTTGGGRPYLGHARLGRLLFQKGQRCLHVALSGRDVQGGVPGSGGQVGVGVIFQQELHHVCVADASCTVKRGLVILEPRAKTKDRNARVT